MTLSTRPSDDDAGLRTGVGGLRSDGAYYPPESISAGKILTSEIISSTETLVSTDVHSIPADLSAGEWIGLTVTANSMGHPVTNLDGQILEKYFPPSGSVWVAGQYVPPPAAGWEVYRHRDLTPNRFMYYSLFAQYNYGGSRGKEWKRIATTESLLPGTWDYAQRMFHSLPQWYQDADVRSAEHLVARLLAGFGAEVDITRSWIETLGDVWDPVKAPSVLLKPLSEVLGLPYEQTVGDPRVRKLLSNLIYLRKTKGSNESVDGYLSALSGYKVLTHQGPNIVVTVENGEFRSGVGNWVADTNTAVTRLDAPVAAGAPPSGNGVLHVERTDSAGVAAAYCAEPMTQLPAIDRGTGREFQLSVNIRTTGPAMNVKLGITWFTASGFSLFNDDVFSGDIAITSTFDRIRSGWLSAPDNARYAAMRIETSGSVDVGVGFEMGQIMLVDRRWRPTYLPGYATSEPFSEAGSDTYLGYDFYDIPRRPWINVFPTRTNFAVNSQFALNNLPSDGWTVTDAPTYGTMPFAYDTYGDVAAGESDYADLARDFNSITPTWTRSFSTANKRLEMISSPGAPYVAQVRSKPFPVLTGLPYSAAVDVSPQEDGTTVSLHIQWMAKEDWYTALEDEDGNAVVSHVSTFRNAPTGVYTNVDLRGVNAPAGAGFGRLIISTYCSVAHQTYIKNAIIEDAPIAGSYFNGDSEDGAPGDFGYVNGDSQSFSVYYLNYGSVLGSSTNRVLTAATEILPMHANEPRVTDAYGGLYDDLA